MPGKRILIAGAGALGSVYGGFLRRAGHQVTLLGREPHVGAVRERGLGIEGIWGEHHAVGFRCVSLVADIDPPFDLTVLAVKSYDVGTAARSLAGSLSDSGSILCVQNGLGNLEAVAETFPRDRVLGAPVLIGAAVPAPGRVRVTVYAKPVKLGAPWQGGVSEEARRWADVFSAAGIPTEATDRILAYLWEKMLYNAALNPLGALLGVRYGRLAERAESRAIMDEVLEEAFAVAEASGVDLLWPTIASFREHFYDVLVPPTVHHRSSMLQDLERGRRTEIDAINGYVWRRGKDAGVATPVNAALTRLVRLLQG